MTSTGCPNGFVATPKDDGRIRRLPSEIHTKELMLTISAKLREAGRLILRHPEHVEEARQLLDDAEALMRRLRK